ncbi:MAG: XisI protein [Bacteroidetes bacterium]|nr:XisI protein [Bacteroidota bacterium]
MTRLHDTLPEDETETLFWSQLFTKHTMGKVKKYQSAILKVLQEYAAIKSSLMPDVVNKVVADTANHHYLLVRMGWHQDKDVYYPVFHFDIIQEKVYVQENRVGVRIYQELIAAGVAENDILAVNKADYPKTVYKYRSWKDGFHKNILLHNELYLASPRDMNDPFDCRITSNFLLLNEKERREYNEKRHVQEFENLQDRKIDIAKSLKEVDTRMQDEETFQRENEKINFAMQDKFIGVLSLSARWDSILMWSHYAASHTGFCVGFHEALIRKSPLFGREGNVEYEDEFPKIKPDADVENDLVGIMNRHFIVTHTKARDWFYEEEYRLTKTFNPNNNEPPLPFERVVKIPDDFFAEVILGMNISELNKREITKLCNQKNIPLYQAKKVPFKFEITKELINP